MLSKDEKYILSLLKKGDVVWQDIGGGLTALKHVKKVTRFKWWLSPVCRSVYGEYGIAFRTQYTTFVPKANDKLMLGDKQFVSDVYMITSSDGHIKYIDVKTFLKCMRYSPYFLNTKRLPKSFQEKIINGLPEYVKKEVCTLIASNRHITQVYDDRICTPTSRCCK
jgi:hypothetical protein